MKLSKVAVWSALPLATRKLEKTDPRNHTKHHEKSLVTQVSYLAFQPSLSSFEFLAD